MLPADSGAGSKSGRSVKPASRWRKASRNASSEVVSRCFKICELPVPHYGLVDGAVGGAAIDPAVALSGRREQAGAWANPKRTRANRITLHITRSSELSEFRR